MFRNIALAAALTATTALAGNPVEVGTVKWSRDLDAAKKLSGNSGKPIFLLFQEIPGCDGCQKFGKQVLTNPLLVEAIEDEFHPVLVHNNKPGKDADILKEFNEPAWNYQVVRFLNAKGKDLIPRKDRIWDSGPLANRMIRSLRAAKRDVPQYLTAIAAEHNTANHAQTAFAMHCYWTGELKLGAIDGVIKTEAGWLENREVTHVTYDKTKIDLAELTTQAGKVKCADKVYTPNSNTKLASHLAVGRLDKSYKTAKASDQKKQIEKWSALHKVPNLTDMQLTKINALAPTNRSAALDWLSPRQRRALEDNERHSSAKK